MNPSEATNRYMVPSF